MYGKQRLLVWTLLILAAGTLLAALAGSLPVLIVARIIQGVAGGIFPLAFAIVRDEFPADRVAGSIGLMSAILGVGGGLGLVVGGLIDEHLSWHWLFWIPLPVMVAAAVCTWRYIPESQVRSPGRVNWAAAALMTAGMSLPAHRHRPDHGLGLDRRCARWRCWRPAWPSAACGSWWSCAAATRWSTWR